jgi:predicted dinucleotide-binding enzyme
MGYHDLHDGARAKGEPDRKAIAIAGNDSGDVDAVTKLVDNLGFDPLYIGKLSEGRKLEAGTRAFGANLNVEDLRRLLS